MTARRQRRAACVRGVPVASGPVVVARSTCNAKLVYAHVHGLCLMMMNYTQTRPRRASSKRPPRPKPKGNGQPIRTRGLLANCDVRLLLHCDALAPQGGGGATPHTPRSHKHRY